MPKFSIIVPVYNVDKYLQECLNSIKSQIYTDYEVLLIDDGSSDNSGKICDEFAQNDVRFKVIHKKNEGVSIARNIGLDNAVGEWISFVDADDYVSPNYLSTFFSTENQADLTYFGNSNIYEDGSECTYIPFASCSSSRQDIECKLFYLKHNCLNWEFFGYTWNKFYRKSIIFKHHIRFVENISIREDEIFTAMYCKYITSLCILKNVLYVYRVSSNGLTYKNKTQKDYLLLSFMLKELSLQFSNFDLLKHENNRILIFYSMAFDKASSFKDKFNITNKKNVFSKNNLYLPLTRNKRIMINLIPSSILSFFSILRFYIHNFYKKYFQVIKNG